MSRKTLYSKEAVVMADGGTEVTFKTNDKATGIEQAEEYVNTNQSDLAGMKVEIFVKHKEYKIEPVSTVKITEV